MAIQPAVVDLPTIYQNASYRVQMRLTDRLRPATISANSVVNCPCHGLAVGAKVVLLSQLPTVTLCGAVLNHIYYISPLDFTAETFRLTTSLGSSNILNLEDAGTQKFFIAQPVDITDYELDADICEKQAAARIQVATFTTSIDSAQNGAFSLKMMPDVSISIPTGVYAYDVSLTPSNGERFYAVFGEVPVAVTRSRE